MARNIRAIVTTLPFGDIEPTPLSVLATAGIEVAFNPVGRRLKASEVPDVISGFDVIVAGTETISSAAIASSRDLKAICRVGIGLDGVDLIAARDSGVAVTYTPDAPSPAVSELTIGLIVDLFRGIGRADRGLRNGSWTRHNGRRVADATIGILGCGRIGAKVISHLLGGFPGVRILAHDVCPDIQFLEKRQVERVSLAELLARSDLVSIHVPLTPMTRHIIGAAEIDAMRSGAFLVNTARGGIVDETALVSALNSGRIAGAAIDVFEDEPYSGPLAHCENALLTCHMGSMTRDCRLRMEIEAAQEAARLARGEPFRSPVPESEYLLAEQRLAAAK